MELLFIYHGDCLDGFGSAFAAYLKYKNNADYYPGMYDGEKPNCKNRDVLIFDYHFKEKQLEEIKNDSKSLILKDHHYSAEKLIGHLPYTYFDNSKSGAVLAWEHFFSESIPEMFLWLQDIDLFQKKYAESIYFHYYISSLPYDFIKWEETFYKLQNTKEKRLCAI